MDRFSRRDAFRIGAGAAGAGLIGASTPARAQAGIPIVDTPMPSLPLEKGATLRVIRPTKFVDPDETVWNENSARYAKLTGIPVRTDYIGWEDIRAQVAVAARTGAGPDIAVGWPTDPHLYTEKIVEMTDVAEYLGKKYGGWGGLPAVYGKQFGTNKWIALPMGSSGSCIVWRKSWVNDAGYDAIPKDLDKFLDLSQKLKKNGHPIGFALGNTTGDGNGTATWLLWAFGGYQADEQGNVTINRPETVEALKYIVELYKTMIPGTLSWLDPSNNKAYLAGEISLTANGASIYFVAKTDPNMAAIAADTEHARYPIGKINRAPESGLTLNAMVFKGSKYPNAAKDYLRFMMEAEQYDPWLTKCLGYWCHPLLAFDHSAVWSQDPKLLPYRDIQKNTFYDGYKGPISAAAAATVAEYILVQMFAAAASGQATPQEAMMDAEKRMNRIYKKA